MKNKFIRKFKRKNIFLLLIPLPLMLFTLFFFVKHMRSIHIGQDLQEVQCLEIYDGDTVLLQNKEGPFVLRLSFIDAPELDQLSLDGRPIGKWARRELGQLLQGKILLFQELEKGKRSYGRHLGLLWPKGASKDQSINWLLVRRGAALLYPFAQFSSAQEKSFYLHSFESAKRERIGIWATEGFISPYEWRKRSKLK